MSVAIPGVTVVLVEAEATTAGVNSVVVRPAAPGVDAMLLLVLTSGYCGLKAKLAVPITIVSLDVT